MVMVLRNYYCIENINSLVKLYWLMEECDFWYGWIYVCILIDLMRCGYVVINFFLVNI